MEEISLMYSSLQSKLIKEALLKRFSSIIEHSQFIQGPEVAEFENAAASYTNSKFAIGCANGTDALTVALMAIDLKPGEIVFTPSFTYVATAEAISILNGMPYFVDVDQVNYNISASSLEVSIQDALSKGHKIKAILSVDLFGNPVDYDSISNIAKQYGLSFISDAAQAFGAKYKGHNVGSLADITTTSFFPTKPLGCYGDGGMIFTDNAELAMKIKSICFHGKGDDKYHHIRVGMNSRLDTIQAAILSEKFKFFEPEIEQRNKLAAYYNDQLANLVTTPTIPSDCRSSWAVYTLMHKNRDSIINTLSNNSIPSNVYYRTPLHLQPAYAQCLKSRDLRNSEQISKEVFCLPMHGYVSSDQAEFIADTTKKTILSLG